jgi:hypothetical protein
MDFLLGVCPLILITRSEAILTSFSRRRGLFTILFALTLFPLLPGTPDGSRFLTPEQKAHVRRRLALDNPIGAGSAADHFSWGECLQAFKSPQVLLLAAALFGNGCTLFSFAYFTPTVRCLV